MKNKLNQDQIAMLIADWNDGELSRCDVDLSCRDCALNREVRIKKTNVSICDMLDQMAKVLDMTESEYETYAK